MSKFEEKKYKQTLANDTPDLWDRIDKKLDDSLFSTDSAPTMDMKPKKDLSTHKKEKIKPSKIYKIAGIIAACLALIIIPLTIKNSTKMASSDLMKNQLESDLTNSITSDEDDKSAPLDNFVTQNNISNNSNKEDASNNSSKDEFKDSNTHIGDHTSKDYANIEDKDKNQNNAYKNNEGEIKLPSNDKSNQSSGGSGADNAGSYSNGSLTPRGESDEHLKEGQMIFRIDAIHQQPKLGLVYRGMVTASKEKTIQVECEFYLSLIELSKSDLKKQLNVGDKIIITVKDTSYAALLDKPYYASSITYQ